MTISTTESRIEYLGNGATKIFAIPFRFLENSHVVVTLVSAGGAQIPQSQGADYTLTGADEDTGGFLTMVVAPPVSSSLIVLRVVPATQETDYISGDPFPAESHERALDKLTMLVQQGEEVSDRALKFPVGDLSTQIGELPAAALRTNRMLAFDDAGRPEMSSFTADQVASAVAAVYGPGGGPLDALAFIQRGPGARVRTAQSKVRDIRSVKDTGALGDGVTVDQDAIARSIDDAITYGDDLFWPAGTYVSTANISNFHAVRHYGPGVVVRGTDTWHITPVGDQQNIVYVGGTNLTANDGLTRDHPTNISQAVDRMTKLGEKAADGRWRIQLFGAITSQGVTLRNLPPFRNRLEIWGEAASLTTEPTMVWDGTAQPLNYAIRGDWSTGCANVFLHFKNLKFTNWQASGLAGGICIWASGNILSENIWANNCAIAAWYRQCYVRHTHGKITNAITYGVSVQYGASGNIGDLSGGGVTFENCGEGVSVGRNTTCYQQGCAFTGCSTDISCTRNSRIRPQGNTHTGWTNSCYFLQAGGVLTPDNGQGYPDIFASTPTDAAPVLRCESGSSHSSIHLRDRDMHTLNIGGSIATISGSTDEVILAGAAGVVGGDFQPARVPAFWFYSPTATLNVEIFISTNNGAGGRLELRGAGAPVLAAIDIPVNATGRAGAIEFRLQRRSGVTAGRFTAEFNSNLERVFESGSTANLNNAAIRAANENTLVYRLVWIPANNVQVQFADMVSYITA